MATEFGISGGYRNRQHQAGLRRIDRRRSGIRSRCRKGRPVAPPQVEVEAEAQRSLPVILPAIGQKLRGNAVVAALAAQAAFGLGPNRGEPCGPDPLRLGFRAPDPRHRHRDLR